MDIGDPGILIATLKELVDSGMSLEAALPAFTSNSAKLLRLNDRGRVAEGMIADLVVLNEQGLAGDVMARGTWHIRDGRAVVHGTFEQSQ